MKRLLFAAVTLAVLASHAEAQQPERNFTLSLTLTEIQKVADILVTAPFKDVAGIIGKIQQQVAAQQQPESPKVPEAPPPK